MIVAYTGRYCVEMAKKNEYSVNQDGVVNLKLQRRNYYLNMMFTFFTKKFNLNFVLCRKLNLFSFIPLLFIFVITYFPISNIILLTKNKLRKWQVKQSLEKQYNLKLYIYLPFCSVFLVSNQNPNTFIFSKEYIRWIDYIWIILMTPGQ